MPALLTILPITAEHYAQWLPLWQGYQRFYQTVIPDETTQTTWQRLLDPQEPMQAALAWLDGVAVGMVHRITHRSTWTVGNYVYLQDLFVTDAVRGQGVGRALIEHVYAQASAQGASRVYWLTHETNQQAMALYEQVAQRSGFIQFRHLL
nr:GNAT family N-acetyltransferase [uncultured Tolumonas sp.]